MDYPLENRPLKISPDSHQRQGGTPEAPSVSHGSPQKSASPPSIAPSSGQPGPQVQPPPAPSASASPEAGLPEPGAPSQINTSVNAPTIAESASLPSFASPALSAQDMSRIGEIRTKINDLRGVASQESPQSVARPDQGLGLAQKGLPRAEIRPPGNEMNPGREAIAR